MAGRKPLDETRVCEFCGKEYQPWVKSQQCCGKYECKLARMRKKAATRYGSNWKESNDPLYCPVCSQFFLRKQKSQKICSRTCYKVWNRWYARDRDRKRTKTPSEEIRIRNDISWGLDSCPWIGYEFTEENMDHVTWSQITPMG